MAQRQTSALELATDLTRACVSAFGPGWLRTGGFVLHWPDVIAESERQTAGASLTGTIVVKADESRTLLAGHRGPGDAEVAQLHNALLVVQEVLGLDIAMQHAGTVGELQGGATCQDGGAGGVGLQAGGHEPLPHRARAPLHDDQTGPVLPVDEVVDGNDVGVVERGHHLGLGHEPGPDGGVGGEGPAELLDRHLSTQLGVASLVDDAEGAATEFLADFVGGQGLLHHRLILRAHVPLPQPGCRRRPRLRL
ncbi:MAG: hypothetical protein AAGK32_03680 [Actinomycetota bacterium]